MAVPCAVKSSAPMAGTIVSSPDPERRHNSRGPQTRSSSRFVCLAFYLLIMIDVHLESITVPVHAFDCLDLIRPLCRRPKLARNHYIVYIEIKRKKEALEQELHKITALYFARSGFLIQS